MKRILVLLTVLVCTASFEGADIPAGVQMEFPSEISASELQDLLTLCEQEGLPWLGARIDWVSHAPQGPGAEFESLRICSTRVPLRWKKNVFKCVRVNAYNTNWGIPDRIAKPSRKGNWVIDLAHKRVIELTALPVSSDVSNITLYTAGISGLSADVAGQHLRKFLSGQFKVELDDRSWSAERINLYLSAHPLTGVEWLERVFFGKDILTIWYHPDSGTQVVLKFRVKGDALTLVKFIVVMA